jgi:hypothetical protein
VRRRRKKRGREKERTKARRIETGEGRNEDENEQRRKKGEKGESKAKGEEEKERKKDRVRKEQKEKEEDGSTRCCGGQSYCAGPDSDTGPRNFSCSHCTTDDNTVSFLQDGLPKFWKCWGICSDSWEGNVESAIK